MRPAGKGPLESLYFQYPHFSARRVAEQNGEATPHKVAISGAGPIGLTAALTLARHGVPSVVLEKKSTFNDGSRAICIARASMHILERIGAVESFLVKALGWRHGRSYFRGQQVYRLEMPHSESEKYLPMYNLQQQYIEQFLWEAAARSPLIDLRWESEVTGIAQHGDGATLAVTTPLGDYHLHAEYVLAADGARSPLRSMLGLRLRGENYEGRYVIADIKMTNDFPTERRAFFEPTSNPGGTILIHKQPEDIWRLDYQLREDESDADAIKEETLRVRVQAILDDIGHTGPWELEWWSLYTANTLCLDAYKHGHLIFIGDSAHIVPIFGVRGLNNGLADAHNIGWKLAMVLNGEAGLPLLDSYSPERRGATLDVFANATKSTRFMTPPTRGWKLAREAALSLAVRHDFTRDLANPRQMQPYIYADSPLTVFPDCDGEFAAGPPSGGFALNARLAGGGYLLDRAGDGFTGLLFCDRPLNTAERDLLERLRELDRRFAPLVVAMAGAQVRDAAIEDGEGDIASLYGAVPGTFYLLRPDLHVAGRWRRFEADEVRQVLLGCLGKAI